MTNYQLQLNNDKTEMIQLHLNNDKSEMIPISTKTILFHSDSISHSINLEGSEIIFANTVPNLGLRLYPNLSFQQNISSVSRICCL